MSDYIPLDTRVLSILSDVDVPMTVNEIGRTLRRNHAVPYAYYDTVYRVLRKLEKHGKAMKVASVVLHGVRQTTWQATS